MDFSQLTDILLNSGMVDSVVLNDDDAVIDTNLMDSDFRNFGIHTVYFIDTSDIGFGTEMPKFLIYSGEMPENKLKDLVNAAHIVPGTNIAKVFRFVKSHLTSSPEMQEQYLSIMSKLLMNKSLDEVSSELSSYTGNLFLAIDISGKLLSKSSPFHINYPLWMRCVEQGHGDELIMDYIASIRNQYSDSKIDETPFVLHCKKSNYYILIVRMLQEGTRIGYYFAFSPTPDFDALTWRMLPLLAQHAKSLIQRLENVSSVNSMLRYNILMDAITGASHYEIGMRTKVMDLDFPEVMRVLIIKSTYFRKPEYIKKVLQPMIQQMFPNLINFPWKDSLIMVAGIDGQSKFDSDLIKGINSICENEKLVCTVSNHFSDITHFARYYSQAQATFKFINQKNDYGHMYYYFNYSIYILLEHVDDDELLTECCHPALYLLRKSDAENNTDLFNTLKVFTRTGFSKNATAKELFIHRNTVSYRIQQIEDICGIDLSNTALLFPFQLSFKIDSFRVSRVIKE